MANNLQPAGSINDIRTKAHLQLSARLQNLDLTPLLVRTLGANIPESIIPYLIWELDMMVPAVPMQALGANPLAILQAALPLHKIMGTPASIINALALCGITATLQEGQASWGGISYPASQGWAVFRVNASGTSINDSPLGVTDGTNRSFTLPAVPNPNSLRVFYSGIILRPTTDWVASGANLTLNFTPGSGTIIGISMRSGSSTPLYFDAVVPTQIGSTLVLPQLPITMELYKNGMKQTGGITSSQLPLVAAIANYFKPARCLLDSVTYSGNGPDFSIAGNVITPTIAPASGDSFISWGTYAGSGTAANFADYETPSGLVNRVNRVFTLAHAPNPAASLRQYLGWLCMKEGPSFSDPTVDYTLSGSTITYRTAPTSGNGHLSFYRY